MYIFVYLCNLDLKHGINVIFDIFESHAFQNIAHVGSSEPFSEYTFLRAAMLQI